MTRFWTMMTMAMLFATAAATPSRADDLPQTAQASFASLVKDYDVPGLIVGVTRDGRHDFYALGLASRADKRPVTPDTLFELGSMSKIFTATLAALAEEQGKLRLDDTVAHHLCADACEIGNGLTLMDLATHHSGGLPLQVPDDIKDTQALVTWLKAWRPAKPGARSYSNISIGLLGEIAGKAMGADYRQAVENGLFPAFGLTNSWIDVPAEKMPGYAFGYDRKTNAPIRVNPGVLDAQAYGVKSSARDMLTVLDVELGLGTASDALRAAVARTQQAQYRTAYFTQGMIWEAYPWPADLKAMQAGNGSDVILHPQPMTKADGAPPRDVILNKTGSTNGFGGYVAIVPSRKIGVVVLANRNVPNEARVKATMALITSLTK